MKNIHLRFPEVYADLITDIVFLLIQDPDSEFLIQQAFESAKSAAREPDRSKRNKIVLISQVSSEQH